MKSIAKPIRFFTLSVIQIKIAEAVRKGRKAEFAAFHAQEEAPDPVSKKTFEESKLQWDLLKQQPHKTMFQILSGTYQLKKARACTKYLDRQQLDVEDK